MKKFRVDNVSINRIFYQNWFINECARRNFVIIPQGKRTQGVLYEMQKELTFLNNRGMFKRKGSLQKLCLEKINTFLCIK